MNRLVAVCRRQHKSLSTERTYSLWLKWYMGFLERRGDLVARTSEAKLEAFLSMLALERHVSASTQNQAFNAIVFFYKDCLGAPLKDIDALRATRPERQRMAISQPDTMRLLEAVPDIAHYPTKLVTRLLYGCGLRVSEATALRVKDVNLVRSELWIMGGKGAKDRVVRIPCSAVVGIEEQLVYAKTIWNRDEAAKIPVELPHLLARKYPAYQFAWTWAWLFPMHNPCEHPREPGKIVRWHLLPKQVQRAVQVAARQLGLCVTPHVLRHCYATHCLDRGTNIKALSEAMGHAQITTTQGYCHAEALSVKSPLDTVNL